LTSNAIEAVGLVKTYGDNVAVDGVDVSVARGSVTAVLGPNGAGKTTTVRILTTLTEADGGQAIVAGYDVSTHPREVRRRIGLAAQDATVDPILTGRENLVMISELHQLRRRAAQRRADELLEEFDLVDAGGRPVGDYSGGMRRRLDLAATLVARPQVLFLDEPTTGLDPRARLDLWTVLDDLVTRGTTVLLTTQYLDEAERLAHDIVVVDDGRVIAQGNARELKRQVGGSTINVAGLDPNDLELAAEVLGRVTGTDVQTDGAQRSVSASCSNGADAVVTAAAAFAGAGIAFDDLGVRQPTLDEVFLTLTGSSSQAPGNRPTHDEVLAS
jgi:ABC-2 type transport system ATP-binding protein